MIPLSTDPDFAPYHLVRTDLPRIQGAGKFYVLQVALQALDWQRRNIEGDWWLMNDGGVLDDSKIKRTRGALPMELTELIVATTPPLPRFTIVKKAA